MRVRDGKETVDAMAPKTAKAKGPVEAFKSLLVSDPARRRGWRKECVDLLSLEKDLRRGMHDIRRAIPEC